MKENLEDQVTYIFGVTHHQEGLNNCNASCTKLLPSSTYVAVDKVSYATEAKNSALKLFVPEVCSWQETITFLCPMRINFSSERRKR